MRKTMLTAAAAAALLVIAAPFAAYAVDEVPDPSSSTTAPTNQYPPDNPTQPSLAGSTAIGECINDVPTIHYSLELTDPNGLSTGNTARLVLSGGGNSHTIPLGELVDGKLSGSVLWPGAAVTDGVASGWPGWEQAADGTWVETDGNFRWTRGNISAVIEVNPQISVALSYPPATPNCATNPPGVPLSDGAAGLALPATGVSAYVVPLGVAGGIAAIAGIVLLVARRRTQG